MYLRHLRSDYDSDTDSDSSAGGGVAHAACRKCGDVFSAQWSATCRTRHESRCVGVGFARFKAFLQGGVAIVAAAVLYVAVQCHAS